jgi:tight adherence protein B
MALELLAAICSGLLAGAALLLIMRTTRLRAADRITTLVERKVAPASGIAWSDVSLPRASTIPILSNYLTNSRWAKRTEGEIAQAGLKIRVGEYLLIRSAAGLTVFMVIWLLGASAVSFVIGLVCGALGFMLPAVWLSILRRRRVEKIGKQLPEALSMLANSLRAGFSFQHGLAAVCDQMEPPISEEFARLIVDMNIGATAEDALAGFLQRADSDDVNLVVTAVLIQRSSGGNLSALLDTVSETMRERERISGEVRTMTSQQRFSGTVLTLWPVVLLGIFALLNWPVTSLLFTSTVGLILLAIGGTLQTVGYLAIRRILDVEI